MSTDLNHIILSLGILLVFGVYTLCTENNRSGKITDAISQTNTLYKYFLKLCVGIFLFCITPLFFIRILHHYLRLPVFTASSVVILLLLSTAVVTVSCAAAIKFTYNRRIDISVKPRWAIYVPLRILFLMAYEFFFRGTFLPLLLLYFPLSLSVAINTFLYALLHAKSGKKEWMGAIPFGLILCILTIQTESVWPAVWLHLLLGMVYEPLVLRKIYSTNKTAIV